MNEIFNPSLLISLGPSAKRALDFSKKQLSYLPDHFLNLIEYYNIEELGKLSEEVQSIIDSKLLAAKNINRLVDLGYRIRSENISAVKINVYFFYDVYDTSISVHEAVKVLSELNYGNVDKDQHSGATLFIFSIMEKEWLLEEGAGIEAIDRLKQLVNYISQEDNMLSIDSKLYVLHSISKDGTRIPKEELQYICAAIVYLNVLPSIDPPLSHFNRRLLMHERAYKVGTVGITSVTVFKDRLLGEFSGYLASDIAAHAVEYETNTDYTAYRVFELVDYKNQQKDLSWGLDLGNTESLNIKLPEELSLYHEAFREWQHYIKNQYLEDIKHNIGQNLVLNNGEIIKTIEKDLEEITCTCSLKEGLKYLYRLEAKIKEQSSKLKAEAGGDLIGPAREFQQKDLSGEIEHHINNYPDLTGYIVKLAVLAAFLFYSMRNLIFPYMNNTFRIVLSSVLFITFFAAAYLNYFNSRERLFNFFKRYKEETMVKANSVINSGIEKKIQEGYREILDYIVKKKNILTSCINALKTTGGSTRPLQVEDEIMGNVITDLFDSKDRRRFYEEKAPEVPELYSRFMRESGGYEQLSRQTAAHRLLEFSRKTSTPCIDLDFYDFMLFKFKKGIDEEIIKWIERSAAKSKYLLQYANNGNLEEHSFFITSPEIFKISKEVIANKHGNLKISIVEGEDVFADSISVIRLCLGIDLDNIASVKKMRRGDISA